MNKLDQLLLETETNYLLSVIKESTSVYDAANRMEMLRTTLVMKLQRLGIDPYIHMPKRSKSSKTPSKTRFNPKFLETTSSSE